jgi:hypothetical protein
MSSSSDPLQNSFDSYEPKQELESPFLNEEYLADEARIAQWRVPVPGVQLESPFLEAFEDGWSSGEVEEFEEEAINEYKSNEKHFITHERLEELQISNSKLPIKEVIYVRGKWNDNKLDLDPWKWAHPRKPRSNTALSLFDYDLGKHKRWDNWDGTLPPTPAPNNESAITSVLDLYAFIKALPSGYLTRLIVRPIRIKEILTIKIQELKILKILVCWAGSKVKNSRLPFLHLLWLSYGDVPMSKAIAI